MELTPEEYKRRLGLLIAGGENPTVPGLNVPPPPAAIGTDPYQGWSQMGTPQTLPSTPSLSPYTQGYSMSGADHPSTPMPAPGVSAAATPAAAQTSIADMVSKEIGKQPATEDTAPTSVAGINESLGAQDVTGTEDTTPPEAAAPEGSSFGQRFVKGLATGGVDLPGMGVYRWTPSGGVMTTIGASTSGTEAADRQARAEALQEQIQARKANTAERAALKETLAAKNAGYAMDRLETQQAGATGRKVTTPIHDFNADPLTKQYQQIRASSDRVLAGLNEGTQVGDALSYVQFAREAGEKGPLSNFDVQTYSGRKDILGRIESYIQKNVTGRMTAQQAGELRSMAEALKTVADQGFEKYARFQAKQQNGNLGHSAQEWYDMFTGAKGEVGSEAGSGGGGGGRFSADGKTFTIPPEHETEFLKDHPDAKRL